MGTISPQKSRTIKMLYFTNKHRVLGTDRKRAPPGLPPCQLREDMIREHLAPAGEHVAFRTAPGKAIFGFQFCSQGAFIKPKLRQETTTPHSVAILGWRPIYSRFQEVASDSGVKTTAAAPPTSRVQLCPSPQSIICPKTTPSDRIWAGHSCLGVCNYFQILREVRSP